MAGLIDRLRKLRLGGGETQDFGLRADKTKKGLGFFGTLQRPAGGVSTELSIGVDFNGKQTEIPSLVPTLDKTEIDFLLGGGKPTSIIVQKAIEHAKERIRLGLSPFAQAGEQLKQRLQGIPIK